MQKATEKQCKSRCENCKKVIINGQLVAHVAKIKCQYCGHINVLIADKKTKLPA